MELSTRSIVIGDEERSTLQKNVWSDKFVSAHMLIKGKKSPFSYAIGEVIRAIILKNRSRLCVTAKRIIIMPNSTILP